MKMEKAIKIGISKSEILLIYSFSNISESLVFIVDWSFIPPISPFFFKLFTDFGIPDIVETSSNIRSNF